MNSDIVAAGAEAHSAEPRHERAEKSAYSAGKTPRLEHIDGLRGVAMLFVFLGHFSEIWPGVAPSTGVIGSYLRLINADSTFGSSLFMLLSAFFTYGGFSRRKRKFSEFLTGRFCRIYPLYLLMNLLYVAGSLLLPGKSKLPHGFEQAAVFTVESLLLLPGVFPVRPLMDVAWTLSFVVLYYFVAAGLASAFRRAGLSRPKRFLFLIATGSLVAAASHSLGWEYRTSIFWAGMALAEAVQYTLERRGTRTARVLPTVLLAGFGLWLRTSVMLRAPHTNSVSFGLWTAMITTITLSGFVWVVYFGPGWWQKLLSARVLRGLGATSYSFYLSHGFAVKAFRYVIVPAMGKAAGTPVVFWSCQIAGILLSIAIARAIFLLVEEPLSGIARRFILPRAQARWGTVPLAQSA